MNNNNNMEENGENYVPPGNGENIFNNNSNNGGNGGNGNMENNENENMEGEEDLSVKIPDDWIGSKPAEAGEETSTEQLAIGTQVIVLAKNNFGIIEGWKRVKKVANLGKPFRVLGSYINGVYHPDPGAFLGNEANFGNNNVFKDDSHASAMFRINPANGGRRRMSKKQRKTHKKRKVSKKSRKSRGRKH